MYLLWPSRCLKQATSAINLVSIGHAFRSHPVMPCAAKCIGCPKGYTEAPWPQLTADDGTGGCPHCLCNPCVLDMPSDFLVGPGPPPLRNIEKW